MVILRSRLPTINYTMKNDRVSQNRLIERVEEIYSTGQLDYSKVQDSVLTTTYDSVSKTVQEQLGVLEQREWTGYGSGTASFLESWFYLPEPRFEAKKYDTDEYSYTGVTVIFSLLEPMFAVYENVKSWSEFSGISMLPSFQSIDQFESSDTRDLAQSICRAIRDLGIPQVSKRTLSVPIDASIRIESNMSNGPLLLFDAFYHWMD